MYEHGTLARPPRRADSGYRLVSWILAVLAALALAAFWRERHRAVAQPPGVLASAEPRQTALDGNVPPIQRGAFLITPAARFELQARVLSRADYHLGKESDLSPTDLVLGWERMSDSSVLARIDVTQSGRWYHWYTADPPIPLGEIGHESANMHMIPADATVAARLARVREGELVHLSGYLVNVTENGTGWSWRSSLSRDDTGGGSCELVYVESLD